MPQSSPDVFREALRGLRDDPLAVAFYLLVTTAALGVVLNVNTLILPMGMSDTPSLSGKLLFLADDVFLAVVQAVVASVAFSRIGRAMDRPLWKVRDDRTALQRFFQPWLILFLGLSAASQLLLFTINPNESATILGWLTAISLLAMWVVPVGACIMFMGKLDWKQLGEGLAPLFRQFSLSVLFLGIGFLANYVLSTLYVAKYIELALLIEVLDGLAECFVFTGIWAVCRYDRDHGNLGSDDFPF